MTRRGFLHPSSFILMGGQNWAFLEPRAASKRHFVVSSSGLSGLHPALPPMAESLGALSSTKFDGEIIENEKRGC